MQKVATKMQLHKGALEQYKQRHHPIWPELSALLTAYGIRDYSIFLDEETYTLFAIFTTDDTSKLDGLSSERIMKAWWEHMKDIMDTNEDNSPVATPLTEMFYLP